MDADASAWIAQESAGGVRSWIAGKSDAAVKAAARLCTNAKKPAKLSDVDALVQLDAGLQNYGIDVVLKWAADHSIANVTGALTETQADHSVNYVTAWLTFGAN